MKKTGKIFGTITAICVSMYMLVIGVLAASQVDLNVSSSVSFESNGTYVKVKGEVQKGNGDNEPIRGVEPSGSDYYYIGYSYDAIDEEQETDTQTSDYDDTPVGTSSYTPMATWSIGEVEFSETESIIRYNLTFTNYSEKPIQATITTNKDTFLSDPDLQGKVNINETSTSLIIDGYDGTTLQTAMYSITLTLTNFSTSFTNKSLTIDVNFSTEIMPQEIDLNGLEYEILPDTNNVEITGYTGTYKNVVIPKGFTFMQKEMPNSFIWEDMNSYPLVGFLSLYFGDFNITFGNGTRRESMNFYEFQLEVQSGGIGEDSFPMTFEQTFNLKIENNEVDLEMLMGYMQFISDPSSMGLSTEFVFELPKVKENASTEWIEFQDLTEFETYVNNVSTSPETVNFPLEFEIEPPKYTATVEGDEYTVTSIGDDAFRSCWPLESVEIPSSVTSIGNYAFYYCRSLETVTFEEGSQLTSIGNYAFYDCSLLETVTFEEGSQLTSIGDSAFYDCRSLTSVEIPSSVTSIGDNAFYDCNALSSMNYLGTISQWCEICFGDGVSNPTYWTQALYIQGEEIINLVIPKGVTSIVNHAFYNCRSLETVTFEEGSQLTSIGNYAFSGCSSLASIEIPSSVTSIGRAAFLVCSSLASIEIPSSVTSIGDSAFNECTSLEYNEYENGKYLGNSENPYLVLFGTLNTTFTQFNINANCKFILGAFKNCSSLENIEIPSSVTSIGGAAFSGCRSLVSIEIPSSVTSIGGFAFQDCSLLETVTFEEGSQLTSIGNTAFVDCSQLASIEIPSSVTSIGSSAFNRCSNLTSVTFADPNGWWYASSSTATSGTSIIEDLSDPAVAATCLKTTYRNYYWKKS